MADRPDGDYADLAPVPAGDVCISAGYEYPRHERYPYWYQCSRCLKRLEEETDE